MYRHARSTCTGPAAAGGTWRGDGSTYWVLVCVPYSIRRGYNSAQMEVSFIFIAIDIMYSLFYSVLLLFAAFSDIISIFIFSHSMLV